MNKIKFSILQKQILLVVTLVILSIGLYAFYALRNFREDKLKYIFQTNQVLSQNIGRSLKRNLQEIKNDLDQIDSIVKKGPLDEASSQLLNVLFKRNPYFAALGIMDAQHPSADPKHPFFLFLASPDFLGSHGLDASALQGFALRFLGDAPDNSADPHQFSFRDRPKEMLLSHNAKENGMSFTLLINKDFIFSALADSEGFDLFLVDAKNNLLASNVVPPPSSVAEHPMLAYANSLQFESGSHNFQLYDDNNKLENYVGSFFKVIPGITLISQVTEQKAMAGIREIAFRSIFFALILAGFGISLGYIYSKTLTAPLLSLMRATEDLAAGNYQIKFDIRTHDEVKELSTHFESLANRLNLREKELEKVTELAIKDGMTGAYNNRHFREKFAEWFKECLAQKKDLCFAIIDVDHFKKFNDTYGHQQGDEVLKQLVKLVQRTVRPTDFVARYGGEEFVILMPETPLTDGVAVAESVRAAYEAHNIPNLQKPGDVIKSTCSIGVVNIRSGTFHAIDEMIELADQNLYKCKKGGRNRVIGA